MQVRLSMKVLTWGVKFQVVSFILCLSDAQVLTGRFQWISSSTTRLFHTITAWESFQAVLCIIMCQRYVAKSSLREIGWSVATYLISQIWCSSKEDGRSKESKVISHALSCNQLWHLEDMENMLHSLSFNYRKFSFISSQTVTRRQLVNGSEKCKTRIEMTDYC